MSLRGAEGCSKKCRLQYLCNLFCESIRQCKFVWLDETEVSEKKKKKKKKQRKKSCVKVVIITNLEQTQKSA